MPKPTSKIYQYYTKENENLYKFNKCNKSIKASTTSNLIKNLETNDDHKDFYSEYFDTIKPDSKKRKLDVVESTPDSVPLVSNLFRSVKYFKNSVIQKERVHLLVSVIIKCMLPISIVRDENFINLLNTFDPSFNVPTISKVNKSTKS